MSDPILVKVKHNVLNALIHSCSELLEACDSSKSLLNGVFFTNIDSKTSDKINTHINKLTKVINKARKIPSDSKD